MGKKYVEDSSVALRKALNIHNCLAIVWYCLHRTPKSFQWQFWGDSLKLLFPENFKNMDLGSFLRPVKTWNFTFRLGCKNWTTHAPENQPMEPEQ